MKHIWYCAWFIHQHIHISQVWQEGTVGKAEKAKATHNHWEPKLFHHCSTQYWSWRLSHCHLNANLPTANPRQKATSCIAYTPPYTEQCLRSTMFHSSGMMELSTIPIANPIPAIGRINWWGSVANGTWQCIELKRLLVFFLYVQLQSLLLYTILFQPPSLTQGGCE